MQIKYQRLCWYVPRQDPLQPIIDLVPVSTGKGQGSHANAWTWGDKVLGLLREEGVGKVCVFHSDQSPGKVLNRKPHTPLLTQTTEQRILGHISVHNTKAENSHLWTTDTEIIKPLRFEILRR